jgi:hypothetical protein
MGDASELPAQLVPEASAVEQEIRTAFKGVSREGGISWSESVELDLYGSPGEQAAARARDKDQHWEDLVDDVAWRHDQGVGGFAFLDAVGFRYYIAPAMIRSARAGGCDLEYWLTIDDDLGIRRVRAIDPSQGKAIARFLRLMIACCDEYDAQWAVPGLRRALESYWIRFEGGSSS